jgi:hypothetical protein
MKLSRHLGARLAALALGLSGLAMAADKAPAWWHSSVTVVNKSKFDIHHIFLSESDNPHWGEDQLGKDILEQGDSLKLTHLECDDYDIKFVDEDGDECVVEEVNLCLEEAKWVITTKDLLECEGW